MNIQFAALKLLEIVTALGDAKLATFSAGGGVVLESMKVSRSGRDNWKPEDRPMLDPEKALRLSGAPLSHDPSLPVNWLSVLHDGRYVAGAYIGLSPGCRAGIPAPVAVKENATPRRGTK